MEHSSFGFENDITLKLSGFTLGEEQILKEQLEVANATITELQSVLASQFSMVMFVVISVFKLNNNCLVFSPSPSMN